MNGGALRSLSQLTSLERRIVGCLRRGLAYKQCGVELCKSEHTVRAYTNRMASRIEGMDELPPRWRVYAWAAQQEWEASHAMPRTA